MKYKAVTDEWDLDFGSKKLEECILFESNNLKTCKRYVKENGLKQDKLLQKAAGLLLVIGMVLTIVIWGGNTIESPREIT